MDSESSCNKRARTAAATLTKPTQLVVCFLHSPAPNKVSYLFDFFKMEDILDYKTLPRLFEPTRTIPWPQMKENKNFTNLKHVSFLHSSSQNDDDGLGVVYAVGGVDASNFGVFRKIPETLPKVLTRISLSGRYGMYAVRNTHMNSGKLLPLVLEIDNLIYVLSAPINIFYKDREACPSYNSFEVYDPQEGDNTKAWSNLHDIPFKNYPLDFKPPGYLGSYKYSHLVLGKKLFVSDNVYSSVYDIPSNTWSACYLFSECPIPDQFHPSFPRSKFGPASPPLPSNCGPGFPFIGQGLLWKGEFLLCMIPGECESMTAYRIDKDKYKARPLQLRYSGTQPPYGRALQIVDIGDDRFALIIITREDRYVDMINILTFKLETDATDNNRLIVKDLKRRYSKQHYLDFNLFAFSFTC